MLQTNCYLVACPSTKETIIVDPGADFELINAQIKEASLIPKVIVNTHAHIDHIGAIEKLKSAYGIKFGLNKKEEHVLKSAPQAASMFGLKGIELPKIDFHIAQGDKVKAGSLTLEVLETPGHTEGSVSFYCDGFVLTGDTLFRSSIGRTDLPGGSYGKIMDSIKNKLYTLKDSTTVYPGHGETTTIKDERECNPYINDITGPL